MSDNIMIHFITYILHTCYKHHYLYLFIINTYSRYYGSVRKTSVIYYYNNIYNIYIYNNSILLYLIYLIMY